MGGERDFTNNFNDKHMCPPRKYALWQERQLTYRLNSQAFLIISRTMVTRKFCDVLTLAIIHENLAKLAYRSEKKVENLKNPTRVKQFNETNLNMASS
jgi:hypothetical protein